jgi:glycosyltransferase involved in cell wall biosynthesis
MILADSPVEFAESVITLLRDPDLRSRQGRAAAEVAANYGWPRIARKFGEVLQGLAGQRLKSDPASVEVGKDLAHSDR